MREDEHGRQLYPQVCDAASFAAKLSFHFDFVTCVPDSIYKKVLPHLPGWEFSPRENHAVAMAFGARIAGKHPVILMQNSGLGLALDSIFGTFELYGQGCLIVVSNRGQLHWEEIQHRHWGAITESLLTSSGIQQARFHEVGLAGIGEISKQIARENKIIALTIQRGNLNE
jgi:sulfopyruvate decarboxylase TPP-binding subunit